MNCLAINVICHCTTVKDMLNLIADHTFYLNIASCVYR